MFSAIRNAALGLTAALCALAASPRVADATVVDTMFGNDPSAGGLISAVFSSNIPGLCGNPENRLPRECEAILLDG